MRLVFNECSPLNTRRKVMQQSGSRTFSEFFLEVAINIVGGVLIGSVVVGLFGDTSPIVVGGMVGALLGGAKVKVSPK